MNFNFPRPRLLTLAADPAGLRGYKVDITRGERIGRVSSEWFSRPDDERYLSLSELYAAVRAGRTGRGPEPWRAVRSGWRRAATMPSGWR